MSKLNIQLVKILVTSAVMFIVTAVALTPLALI